mmetsp:Transcript_4076/g.15088  ORF Transcript_4076/g.15088 Transcript_4076/m.15088 type:complete len:243 (-) Transcript_4076:199-927(-)
MLLHDRSILHHAVHKTVAGSLSRHLHRPRHALVAAISQQAPGPIHSWPHLLVFLVLRVTIGLEVLHLDMVHVIQLPSHSKQLSLLRHAEFQPRALGVPHNQRIKFLRRLHGLAGVSLRRNPLDPWPVDEVRVDDLLGRGLFLLRRLLHCLLGRFLLLAGKLLDNTLSRLLRVAQVVVLTVYIILVQDDQDLQLLSRHIAVLELFYLGLGRLPVTDDAAELDVLEDLGDRDPLVRSLLGYICP